MKVLVLYHAGFTYTPAIEHYLTAFKRHSAHEIRYFNIDQPYDVPLDFSGYDAVFVNYCVSSASIARYKPLPYMLGLVAALRWYRGVKVVAAQDEYDFTNSLKRFVLQIKADIFFTCVPQNCLDLIYPELEFANMQFETVQTAYLAEDLLEVDAEDILPLSERLIPLGYRGRNLPYRLGDIGWHKSEVGVQFKNACVAAGIRHDIEVSEDKRFAGAEWLSFVRRCRVMLGSPSGANVFDFDGVLHQTLAERMRATPTLLYEDVRDEIRPYETDRDMGQVSARVYEAVAQRTALALVRGSYSGVLDPEEHYVPIETDYSNVETVLNRVLDLSAMQAMADRAYTHVLNSKRNRYSYMVERFDKLIETCKCSPAREGVRSPRVTLAPLGCDPYLFDKLVELRVDLHKMFDDMREMTKLVSENRLEVIAHPDGTYRILKHAEPQVTHDSDWQELVDAGMV